MTATVTDIDPTALPTRRRTDAVLLVGPSTLRHEALGATGREMITATFRTPADPANNTLILTADNAAASYYRIGPHGTDAVRIGVRPEKVRLSPAGSEVSGNVLRGTVVVASFLGVSIQYVIRAAGGEELTVFAQNLDGAEPESLGPGREVQLSWDPQHTFVVAKEGS